MQEHVQECPDSRLHGFHGLDLAVLELPSVSINGTLNQGAKFASHYEEKDLMQQNAYEQSALETATQTL